MFARQCLQVNQGVLEEPFANAGRPVLYEIFVKEKSTALSDEGENACLIRVVVVCVSTFQACEEV